MKELAIAFHNWMRKNDIKENAETYFHYTDEDMYNAFMEEYDGIISQSDSERLLIDFFKWAEKKYLLSKSFNADGLIKEYFKSNNGV